MVLQPKVSLENGFKHCKHAHTYQKKNPNHKKKEKKTSKRRKDKHFLIYSKFKFKANKTFQCNCYSFPFSFGFIFCSMHFVASFCKTSHLNTYVMGLFVCLSFMIIMTRLDGNFLNEFSLHKRNFYNRKYLFKYAEERLPFNRN